MSEKFEVSSVAYDAFQFYLALAAKTREDIAGIQQRLTESKSRLEVAKKQALAEESNIKELEQDLQAIKQKDIDIKSIISELEKNKAQFKSIVSGN